MRKLILVIGIALFGSCVPGKSDKQVRIDVYCDSCYIKVSNEWSSGPGQGQSHVIEYPFDGVVVGSKLVTVNRFDSPNNCIRVMGYENYAGTSTYIFYIENNDTIGIEIDGVSGYCN